MASCRKCGVELAEGENWYPSNAKTYNYICAECVNIYKRQWDEAHRERERERKHQWYKAHREEQLECQGQWRENNPDYNRQWVKNNPDWVAARDHRRRALKLSATIGPVDYAAIYERDKICIYCGSDEDLTIDHLIPLSRGGAHRQENLAVACGSCNSRKHTKTYDEFLEIM